MLNFIHKLNLIRNDILISSLIIFSGFILNSLLKKFLSSSKSNILSSKNIIILNGSINYLTVGLLMIITGTVFSLFKGEIHFLIILGTYILSLGVTKIITDILENKIFFNISFVYGIMLLIQDVPIFNLFYKELSKIKLNLIIFQFHLISLLEAIVYIFIAYNVYFTIDKITGKVFQHQKTNNHIITRKILECLFYFLIIIIFCTIVGIKKENITMILSAIGVGLGFGLQKIFANIFSGFVILYEEKLRVGDLVTLLEYDISGNIISIGSRSSVIRNFDQHDVIVPNDILIATNIVNMDLNNRKCMRKIEFTIDQKYELDFIIEKAIEVAKSNKFVSNASCIIQNIDINGFLISLRIFSDDYNNSEKDIWQLRSDVIIQLQKTFKEYGIRFANTKIEKICQV